jgi:hypothetical protein
MKNYFLYSLCFTLLLSSCSRGIYVTIDGKKYNYSKNTVVRLIRQEGAPIWYGLDIKAFKKSSRDSSIFLIAASRANITLTAGNYSFPNIDSTSLSTSAISYYDNSRNRYVSGGDEIYGTTFFITSLNKKRAKGYFKGKLVDIKADTAKPSNTIYVEGRFNLSLKNALHQ